MKSEMNAEPDAVQQNSFSASFSIENENGRPTPRREDSVHILLVDDHPVVRKGLVACLSNRPDLVVVGEAANGIEAIRKVGELSPDLVLMDVEMPAMDGLAATDTICKRYPKTKVLVVSMHNNPNYVIQAIQVGARGFSLKTAPSEELLKAIDIVQRGEPFFPGHAMAAQRSSKNPAAGPDGLFEREKEVLVYLAMGYSNRDIAVALSISIRTVESHRARLMRKLNIHTIAGLTRYALAKDYISLNPAGAIPLGAEQITNFPRTSRGLRV